MWTPTHIVVTIIRARNLLDKGKNGNDAYCMIGMGKEKYLTSVKLKTLSPTWDEQAEFGLGERADLKVNVYHKSSIIDEFVGRVVISLTELYNENYNSLTKWYKLTGKPDKVENSKKADKERGEIEIRIEFVIRPKAGSMMDLSIKSKDKSLSLKNLKEKSINIKQSLGDKFKILNKSKKPKFAGENQLAEQAKKMGGSKLDFLEGEDAMSIASSYSSINGPTLNRDPKVSTMSRFNPARSSFISKSSSRNDSFSFNGGDNQFDEDGAGSNEPPNNEQDYNFNVSSNNSPFRRQNSSRFNRNSIRSNGSMQRPTALNTNNEEYDDNLINTSLSEIKEERNVNNTNNSNEQLHIAPLPPFMNSSSSAGSTSSSTSSTNSSHISTPTSNNTSPSKKNKPQAPTSLNLTNSNFNKNSTSNNNIDLTHKIESSRITSTGLNNSIPNKNIINTKIEEELSPFNTPTIKLDFSDANKNLYNLKSLNNDISEDASIDGPIMMNFDKEKKPSVSSASSYEANFERNDPKQYKAQQDPHKVSQQIFENHDNSKIVPVINIPASQLLNTSNNINSSSINDEEDEDHIDWASSDDEEIVKKEIETFERNQVFRQSERKRVMPTQDLVSDLNTSNNNNNQSYHTPNINHSNNNNDSGNTKINDYDWDLKTPDFNEQDLFNGFVESDLDRSKKMSTNERSTIKNNDLPDIINQNGNNNNNVNNGNSADRARKYLEGLDGVKFNEIDVPDTLKKQLEFFDREELLQLIAYQKKYLDYKESRIKDLENYIDNLVVKIIETEPLILMNASNVLNNKKNKLI